ncbi:MliC family protein [Paracoccus benzoatiresistens]|uniref:MliC family protein n=1 Tax=Paracoccus benzoatiresistens TaxID=2997341 RepID=A0ABT4J5B8_9RHOB|nr:MliC family protein [Paracoccus sp. EF6]MCZ0962266.1 MliC family protein [Paracoccus sp. EF6]
MIRALILAACCPATMTLAQTDDLITATYLCERGVQVSVVFINPEGGASYAVARIDDKLLGMRQVVSGSGARYRSGDGPDAYQLWVKGDDALISVGPDGQDRTLFRNCSVQR